MSSVDKMLSPKLKALIDLSATETSPSPAQKANMTRKIKATIRGQIWHWHRISPEGRRIFSAAQSRAKKKGLPCMSAQEYLELWVKRNGRCAVSGIKFSEAVVGTGSILKRPWRPSLDQLNPNRGYARDNVQIVCQIANFAMSEYKKTAFYKLCTSVSDQRSSKRKARLQHARTRSPRGAR